MSAIRIFSTVVVALAAALWAPPAAFAQPSGVELLPAEAGPGNVKRYALVIGNGDYRNVSKLRNTNADAVAMARAVQRLGFNTLLARDLTRLSMNEAVAHFLQQIEPGSETLVYYAGHGVEMQGANYLLPTDIPALGPDKERLLRSEGVNLTDLLLDIEGRSARMSLVILDACRENPFPRMGTRSLGATRGLTRVEPPRGSFVLFAAGAGELAIDSLGAQDRDPNGLFTRRLLRLIDEEGLELRTLMQKLRDDVSEAAQALAGRQQMPAYYDQMRGQFYFRPPRTGAEPPQTQCDRLVDPQADRATLRKADLDEAVRACTGAVEAQPGESRLRRLLQAAQDQRAYARAIGSQDRGLSQAYLEFFPNGRFGEDVRQHLTALAPSPAPVAPSPPPSRAWTGRDCPQCPEMVSVPLGSFVMGAAAGEEEREKVLPAYRDRASPQRTVSISKAFSLGRHEVTRGQYAAFVAATGRQAGASCHVFGSDGKWKDQAGMSWLNPGFAQTDSDPVVCVSWGDAQAYAQWLAKTTGKGYRLPSEAEWEYAARGGTSTARYWGDGRAEACRHANVSDRKLVDWGKFKNDPEEFFQCSDGYSHTAPVGKFQANGFGFFDMLGNAWEWVEDCWNGNYQGASSGQESRVSGDCCHRVLRGGGWDNNPPLVRAAYRSRYTTGYRDDNAGFRVARTD